MQISREFKSKYGLYTFANTDQSFVSISCIVCFIVVCLADCAIVFNRYGLEPWIHKSIGSVVCLTYRFTDNGLNFRQGLLRLPPKAGIQKVYINLR